MTRSRRLTRSKALRHRTIVAKISHCTVEQAMVPQIRRLWTVLPAGRAQTRAARSLKMRSRPREDALSLVKLIRNSYLRLLTDGTID